MKGIIARLAVLALVAALGAGEVMAAGGFQPAPAEAKKALKASVGKPINNGWVFVNGKYIPPPYKVMRLGTVMRINDQQVTGEIIPWNEFVKTQAGAKVTRSQSGGGEEAAAAAPEPEPEPEPIVADDDDWENSLDDLFSDDPAPKKSGGQKSGSGGYKPRPKKPTVTVTYTLEGDFVPNAKSDALLTKLNDYRTRIDANLRSGGCYFFSSRYTPVVVDSGATRIMADKLPGIMKAADSQRGLYQAARAAGLAYITAPIAVDLYKNKVDYFPLEQRNRAKKDRSSWTK